MKRRMFTILACLALCLGLLPAIAVQAGAAGGTITVGGVNLTVDESGFAYAKTDPDGIVTVCEESEGWTIKWDGTTLTLNGAVITGSNSVTVSNSNQGIYCNGNLQLVLIGENEVIGVNTAGGEENGIGIEVGGALTITGGGTGSLTASGPRYGIYSGDHLTIESGTVEAVSSGGTSDSGIYASNNITIWGGSVTARANGTSGNGIHSAGTITIKDGTVEATGGKNGIYGSLDISGGEVTATGGENGISGPLTISGGEVTADGDQYGISGSLYIYGGEVTATGGTACFAPACSLSLYPLENTQIIVRAGTDEANAAYIPIPSDGTLLEKIQGERYFHSETGPAPNLYVGGVGLYGDTDTVAYATTDSESGEVTPEDDGTSYNIKWDGSTLTLRAATISNISSAEDAIYSPDSLQIELEGENTIRLDNSDGSGRGIFSDGEITITGDDETASLAIEDGGPVMGIIRADRITIKGGTVTAEASGSGCGIYAADAVDISGGVVKAEGGESGCGIYAHDTVEISGGVVTATTTADGIFAINYGIYAAGTVDISGGVVTATTDGDGCGIYADDTVEISDGTVKAEGGESGCGIRASNLFVSDNGDVTASGSCCIDIRDTVDISGGTVKAEGGESGYGIQTEDLFVSGTGSLTASGVSSITANSTVEISGGTVEATSTGMNYSGISAYAVDISGGEVTGVGQSGNGISASYVDISGGTVTANGKDSDGIYAIYNITIEDGIVTATATGEYGCGIYATSAEISGGMVEATSAGMNYSGISAYDAVTISDGIVKATATGESGWGLYSNSVKILGGQVTANATGEFGWGINADALDISGGTVTATADYYGICARYNITISGGTVEATTTGSAEGAFACIVDEWESCFITITPPPGWQTTVLAREDAASTTGDVTQTYGESGEFPLDSPYQYIHIFSTSVSGDIPVAGVELDESDITLVEGETAPLTATVKPDDATDQTVTWTSSDPSVATVDQTGLVTAVGPGSAAITAQAGNRSTACGVQVIAKSYQISASPAELNFASAADGYAEAPEAQTVTITNTGNQTVTISLPSADNYTVTAVTGFDTDTATLAPGGTAQFSVQPIVGLDEGVYDTALNISGDDGAGAEVKLNFVVTEAEHIHIYEEGWKSDRNGHWHECPECGAKTDMEAHSGGSATCLSRARCDLCWAEYGEFAEHSYNGEPWQFDRNYHWRECRFCGAASPKEAHTFRNGVCTVCYCNIDEVSAEYTIYFDANGGYVDIYSAETENGMLKSLPYPTRTGYDFIGWYTEPVGGTQVTDGYVFTDDTDLYAHWQKRDSGNRNPGDADSEPSYSVSLPGKVEGGEISAKKRYAEERETFRFTVTPDEGYELESITVTDNRGRELDLKHEGDGEYSFKMPAGRVEIAASFRQITAELSFTDVPENYWAYDEIAWAYENGYMNGTSAATFNPGGTITRQQMWMILARMSGAYPANMAEAKAWALANGISDGTNPGNPVTRQQLAAMLYRYAVLFGYNVSVGESANILSYTDAGQISEYAIPAMQWACGAGIIAGTSADTLSPHGSATRAQLAVMLYRWQA